MLIHRRYRIVRRRRHQTDERTKEQHRARESESPSSIFQRGAKRGVGQWRRPGREGRSDREEERKKEDAEMEGRGKERKQREEGERMRREEEGGGL